MSLLHIENLSVSVRTASGLHSIIDRLSFRMSDNEILGIVGESGSGKSILAVTIMGLLSPNIEVRADYLSLDGEDLMKLSAQDRRQYISSKAAIIFQDPKSSLNPCYTVSAQIDETLSAHGLHSKKIRRIRMLELLDDVGITQPEIVLSMFPHQLSGGMNQRIAIAIAIACKPKLLIADEPTTALDLTIQSQILDLIVKLNKEDGVGVILITHDFSLLAENTDKVAVIYSGQLMEHASTKNILSVPHHPYTQSLIGSVSQIGKRHTKGSRLFALKGQIPTIDKLPVGCRLGPRCPNAQKNCVVPPRLQNIPNHGKVRCHIAERVPRTVAKKFLANTPSTAKNSEASAE